MTYEKQELIENLTKALKEYSSLLEKEPDNIEYQEMYTKAVLALSLVKNEEINVVKNLDIDTAAVGAENGKITLNLGRLYYEVKDNPKDLVNLIAHEMKHVFDKDVSNEIETALNDIVNSVARLKAEEIKRKYGFDINPEQLKPVLSQLAHRFYNIVADVVINSEQNIERVGPYNALTYKNTGPFILKEGEAVVYSKLEKVRELLAKQEIEIQPGGGMGPKGGGIPVPQFDDVKPGGISKDEIDDIIRKTRVSAIEDTLKDDNVPDKTKGDILDKMDKYTNKKDPFKTAGREKSEEFTGVTLEHVDFKYSRITRFIENAEETYSYERTYRRERHGIAFKIPIPYYSIGVLVDTSGSVANIVGEFAGVLRRLAKDYHLVVGVFSSYDDYYIFELQSGATASEIERKFKAFLGGTEILGVWRAMYKKYKFKHYIILSDFEFADEKEVVKFVKENRFKILAIVNKDIYNRRGDYIRQLTDESKIIIYERVVIKR